MVFFNLSVNFAGGQLSVTHFPGDMVRLAPACQKTKALRDQKDTLTVATNTSITFVSTPVPFRLDVAKSKMESIKDNELCKKMPQEPVPARSVADTARITSKMSTDLIAIVKDVGEQRTTKSGLVVADVTLIDNSETSAGVLATIKVAVFGVN